jgi:Ca-activated chloride channel family protein
MSRVLLRAAVLGLCLAVTLGARQQPRFRTTAELVRVDVQVKDGGRPIGGLTAADFELRDSGVRQHIEALAFTDVPLSVLLALDASASLEGAALEQLKEAAHAAIGALREGDEAAILTFGERIDRRATWTADANILSSAIDGIEGRGSTALNDALLASLVLSQEADGRRLAIVFTDGRDTISYLDPASVLQAARHDDVVFYTVSAGPPLVDANRDRRMLGGRSASDRFEENPKLYPFAFLQKLTEETGGQHIRVESTRDLAAAFAAIVNDFKTRYLLTYAPKGVPKSGWHPIDVKVKGRGTVTARRGYTR